MNTSQNCSGNESVISNSTSYNNRNEALAQVEIGVQAAIFILAVFGNSIVLLVLLLRRRRLTRMHLLLLHLSAADLFVAFFSVLPQLIWDVTYVFHGNDFLCRSVKYFQIVAIYASAYVLVMTAIDRYIAVCHPFLSHKWSSRKVHLMVTIAWTLSLFFSLPQLFIFSYMERNPGVYDCWATFNPEWTLELYILCNTLSVYVGPTCILVFCYGRICYTVWKRGKVGEQVISMSNSHWTKSYHRSDESIPGSSIMSTHSNSTQRIYRPISTPNSSKSNDNGITNGHKVKVHEGGITRAKAKTIRLTLTVVLCYLVCWSPFYVAQMWAAFDPKAPFGSATYAIILLLASLNSCTNPWIYLIFSGPSAARTSLRQMCSCLRGKHCRQSSFTAGKRIQWSSGMT